MKKHTRTFQKALATALALIMALAVFAAFPVGAADVGYNSLEAVDGSIPGGGIPSATPRKIYVSTAQELATLVMPAGETTYVELTADIDMSDLVNPFTPLNANMSEITDYDSPMKNVVIFEGNGHTISNMKVTTSGKPGGLFMYLYNGSVVRNLKFADCDVSVTGWTKGAGILAGDAGTQITVYNVSTDVNCSVTATDAFPGGLIGSMANSADATPDKYGTVFSYCVNNAKVEGCLRVGGLVGAYQSLDPIAFRSCVNNGTVTNQQHGTHAFPVGGILGTSLAGYANKPHFKTENVPHVFEDCVNTGKLEITPNLDKSYATGGIVGSIGGDCSNSTFTFTRCYDTSVRSDNTKVKHGAFIASIGGKSITFTDCAATGSGYETAIANSTNTYAGATIGADATVATKVSAIETAISGAMAALDTIQLDISKENENLSLRMRLKDPFGFMAITSFSVNDTVIAADNYDDYVTDYGFIFMRVDADEEPTKEEMIGEGTRASGEKYVSDTYAEGKKFCATFEGLSAYELGGNVAFVAYVAIKGCVVVSEVRILTPIEPVRELATGDTITRETEKAVYASMVVYYERYANYYNLLNASKKTPDTIKVGSYNIYHGADWSLNDNSDQFPWIPNPVSLDNIANVIFQNNLDVCGMQETSAYVEIYANDNKTQAQQVAEALAELTGETWYYGFAAGTEDGHYKDRDANDKDGTFGNSIVSRYPISNVKSYTVTGADRCVLVADLNVNGTEMCAMVTHLENTNAGDAATAATEICALAKTMEKPIILMGDLNVKPEETAYTTMVGTFTTTVGENGYPYTHSSTAPGKTIDYIMYIGDGITARDLHTDPTARYSDHLPLMVTLDIPKK